MPSFTHGENSLLRTLGISDSNNPKRIEEEGEDTLTEDVYEIVHDPQATKADFSTLLGAHMGESETPMKKANEGADLENLAELVPDIKERRSTDDEDVEGLLQMAQDDEARVRQSRKLSMASKADSTAVKHENDRTGTPQRSDSMKVLESKDSNHAAKKVVANNGVNDDGASSARDAGDLDDYPDSDHPGSEGGLVEEPSKIPKEFLSSNQSLSTATQTHQVSMPMYLPTFKPATGCTNASDFIVRCFIARLRAGITVVKHGRSRWCKSRLRVLHIHPDGRSLSWKPAEGEPNSSKRPPKLDLTTCLEVRHAWSPDPQNPMYTGTPILRQKCEAANAHKSFALIFKQRTVDITAVTADQCKVLMEGFSALCFRLQVATLAGRRQAMPEEDGVSTTASATLTNTSAAKSRP